MLMIPKGFAHGFLVMSDDAIVHYKCDELYHPSYEGGIRYDDPDISIKWPFKKDDLLLSDKDRAYPLFKNQEFRL